MDQPQTLQLELMAQLVRLANESHKPITLEYQQQDAQDGCSSVTLLRVSTHRESEQHLSGKNSDA